MRATLCLVAVGLLSACRGPAAPPPAAVRLVPLLPMAEETPSPPPERTLLRLDGPLPVNGQWKGRRLPAELNQAVVVRSWLSTSAARVELRLVTDAEAPGLAEGWQTFAGSPPGTSLGSCAGLFSWPAVCTRTATVTDPHTGLWVVVQGPVERLEVLASDEPDPRAPYGPVVSRLIRWTGRQSAAGTSFRDALVATAGSRYTFSIRLPAHPHLHVALGYEGASGTLQFRVLQDGAVAGGATPAPGDAWSELDVDLKGEAGNPSRITLETEMTAGANPDAGGPLGLWGDPVISGPSESPNLILITMDAVRADHLSCASYPRDTTPTVCSLGESGTRFAQAFSQGPSTWVSMSSLLTGRLPTHAGVTVRGERVPAEISELPELLSQGGYYTFAGSNLADFPPSYVTGFEEASRQVRAGDERPDERDQIPYLVQLMRARPTFIWWHLEHAHYPLHPSEPMRYDRAYEGRFRDGISMSDWYANASTDRVTPVEQQHLVALYDSGIRDDDAEVRELLAAIDQAGLRQRTVVVVTADHGELLGEHQTVLNHGQLYSPVLHVPLVIAWPGHLPAQPPSSQDVALTDLAPTLLSLAGLARPPGLDGQDLSPGLRGGPIAEEHPFAQAGYWYSLISGMHHLLAFHTPPNLQGGPQFQFVPPAEELFDMSRDPSEAQDLTARDPVVATQLFDELRAEVAHQRAESHIDSSAPIGQAALDMLAAAGYLPAADGGP